MSTISRSEEFKEKISDLFLRCGTSVEVFDTAEGKISSIIIKLDPEDYMSTAKFMRFAREVLKMICEEKSK